MKKNIYTLFISALLLWSSNMYAQPGENILASSRNPYIENPAAPGLDGKSHLYLGAYTKWIGTEGAPTTAFISATSPVFGRNIGMGGIFIYDQAGLINHGRLGAFFAAHSSTTADHRVSLGAMAQFQFYGFDVPNVPDPVIGEIQTSPNAFNLGLGLNYHGKLSETAQINLMAYYPQLPLNLELNDDTLTSSIFKLTQNIILQANLNVELANGMMVQPSVRYQAIPEGDFWATKQIIDIGLGLTLSDDRFRVRLGGRNTRTSAFYIGVGMRLSDKMDANLAFEPLGELGMSGGADLDIVLRDEFPEREPRVKEPKVREPKTPRIPKEKVAKNRDTNRKNRNKGIPIHQDIDKLKFRLASTGLNETFDTEVISSDNKKFTSVAYSFSDNTLSLDLSEDSEFQYELPRLWNEIQELLDLAAEDGGRYSSLALIAEVRGNLDGRGPAFRGESRSIQYKADGELKTIRLQKDQRLTSGELAAVKLDNLKKAIEANVESISDYIGAAPPVEVKSSPNLEERMSMTIRIVLRNE